MSDVKFEADKYKLTLAQDLILYLSSVLTYNMNKQQSSQFLGQTIEAWSRRVEGQLGIMHQQNIEAYKTMSPDLEDDVIDILVQIHTIMPTELRKEFANDTFKLFQSVVDSKED